MKEYGRLPVARLPYGNHLPDANVHAVPLFNAVVPASRHLAKVIFVAETSGIMVLEAGVDCHGCGRYAISYDLRLDSEHCAKFDCFLGALNNPSLTCYACREEEDLDIEFYGGYQLGANRAVQDLINEWIKEGQCQIWHLAERLKNRKRLCREELWFDLKMPKVFELNPGFQEAAERHASGR